VRPEMLGPEPHRGDLAATGPAGAGWAGAIGSVEPEGGVTGSPHPLARAPTAGS
jgi:hypothetical protein